MENEEHSSRLDRLKWDFTIQRLYGLYNTRESLYGFTSLDGRRPSFTRIGTNIVVSAYYWHRVCE